MNPKSIPIIIMAILIFSISITLTDLSTDYFGWSLVLTSISALASGYAIYLNEPGWQNERNKWFWG